jgi:hypothetical protein
VKLFLVVSIEIYKTAPERLPALTLRFREVVHLRGLGLFIAVHDSYLFLFSL